MSDKELNLVLLVSYLWVGLMVATAWLSVMAWEDESVVSVDRALIIYIVSIIAWPLVVIALAAER